jgi:hypothetical protein
MDNKKNYVCTGSCQAVVTEEEYNKGLTNCGAEGCTMKGHPLVQGKKSEITGKNEPKSA